MEGEREASFGEKLRRLREAVGLTQEELAERAGLTAQAVGVLERGRRQHPHLSTVRALADALELSSEERAALLASVPKRGESAPTAATRSSLAALPVPPTSLVGRGRELEEVRDLIREGEARLLTLTGPGGVGKTRLAIQLAGEVEELFPDGVAFVPLAPLGDASLVVPTIARSLGLVEAGGRPLVEAVRTYLRDRRMLVVLDNFEHVLDASLELAALLSSCPVLTVLVTSRAPLRVQGEREYHVGPLGLPEFGDIPAREDAARSDAVMLFVQRARDVSPGFELTRENTAAVAAICRRLDGLPLAIELAAARVRALMPMDLLARLDRSLPLLTGGARDLPERQRTMRATIEWSYQLLGESQWRLFNRLSVFPGGWDLEAAEAVGAGGDILEEVVLDLRSGLVEQSLVLADTGDHAATRYRMLEPLREYAEERLTQSGEAEETKRRHAVYYLAWSERSAPDLSGHRQVEWLDRFEQEHDNLRAAMNLSLQRGETEKVARLAWASWLFWWLRGHQREGLTQVEEALVHDPAPAPRAVLLRVAAMMAFTLGQRGANSRYAQESLELAREVGDLPRTAHALHGVAVSRMQDGEFAEAEGMLEEAQHLYQRVGNDHMRSAVLTHRGTIRLAQGDAEAAVQVLEEALAIARRTGEGSSATIALYFLATIAQSRERWEEAADLLTEGVEIAWSLRDRANLGHFLHALAVVTGSLGGAARSARLLGAADGLLGSVEALTYTYYRPDPELHAGGVEAAQAALGEEEFEALRAEGRAMSLEQVVSYALEGPETERERTPDPLKGS